MAKQLFVNNWSAALQADLAPGASTMLVEPGLAAKLVGLGTGDFYLVTLAAVDSSGAEEAWEIIRVTAAAGGTLTINRAQEGTTAQSWLAGAHASARLTAGGMVALQAPVVGGAAWGSIDGVLTDQADLATALSGKVDKEAGKGLSQESFTTAEKTKLGGVATNATANPDTDSLAEGATNQYFTAARVRAVLLTGLSLATNAAISAADSVLVALGKLQAQITAHFGAGGSAHADATTGASGFMSAADKTKLNGVASGANNYSHPNHTGDVTSGGDGAQTIAANAVSNAKLADVATGTLKGRVSAGSGDPEDLTPSQVRTLLNVVEGGGGWDALSSPSIVSGALALDLANPVGFVVSLTANITSLTFTNTPSAKVVTFSLEFVQDATGGRTITWPGSVTAANGGALPQPTAGANTVTIFTLQTRDGGTSFKLFTDEPGMGFGQSWNNLSASRALGTTYTNTTGKPIQLAITLASSASAVLIVTIGATSMLSSTIPASSVLSMMGLVVPPGVTYSASISAGTPVNLTWQELR